MRISQLDYLLYLTFTEAHRGHAANKIIAVTLFKLQKLYNYCSN